MTRIVIVGVLLGAVVSASLVFQAWQLWAFVNAGPRFTADDGQVLCDRVRALEGLSPEFRQSGRVVMPCTYGK